MNAVPNSDAKAARGLCVKPSFTAKYAKVNAKGGKVKKGKSEKGEE
ncbi:MAG: hypothetical protein KA746_05510 [Pyrinomonadaceae bacterium]|nr:hypothetical protein [Pyrinomonadaceae bacterium]MBP6212729.1 hypothetical protein [Pyrinomonadaceae bacterium]